MSLLFPDFPERHLPCYTTLDYKPPMEFPALRDCKWISCDLETQGLDPLRGSYIVGVGIKTDHGLRQYYPIRHQQGMNCDDQQVMRWLRNELLEFHGEFIGTNSNLFDYLFLACRGVHMPYAQFRDIQWAEPLLDEYAESYSLESLGQKYAQTGKKRHLEEIYGEKWKAYFSEIHPAHAFDYVMTDIDLPPFILECQKKALAEEGLSELYDLESRLTPLLIHMKRKGVPVDLERAQQLEGELKQKYEDHLLQMKRMVGFEVDPFSGLSLAKTFDSLGIHYPRTAKDNPSFKNTWLATLDHPFAGLLNEAREYEKLRGTFVEGYILNGHIDGRIHANFHPLRRVDDEGKKMGTVSGRFSSTIPNLQNIPIRTDLGKLIRELFTSEQGMDFYSADYSQMEYRILVHYASLARCKGAETARKAYQDAPDMDFHAMVAELTGIDRRPAKTLNFGLCIAEGQRVLTNKGLVPIEQVTREHHVWDGVAWVKHEGVICNGEKETIEYGGLRATPDHIVWLANGRQVSLGDAASSLARPRLAVTGVEKNPVGFAYDSKREDTHSSEVRSSSLCNLLVLRENFRDMGTEYSGSEDNWLSDLLQKKILGQEGGYAWQTIRRYAATLHTFYFSELEKLWFAWDSEWFQVPRTLHSLCAEVSPSPGLYRCGYRSPEQRRALRTRQSPPCLPIRKLTQPLKVYDIIGAGPRNRFTVEGRLVHNCYGMGVKKLAASLNLVEDGGEPLPEALKIMETYHKRAPFIKEIYNLASERAQKNGYVKTILNRRCRFNLYEPRYRPEGAFFPALPYKEAVASYGTDLKRSGTHKALNRVLQGSNADATKRAMVNIWESGLLKDGSITLALTVHDELAGSVAKGSIGHLALRQLTDLMKDAIQLRVPVQVGADTGKNWAEAH